MATKVPGWAKFAGIALVVVVLLGAGLASGSFFLLRSSVRQFDAADRSFETVVERHGAIAAYQPEPGGEIRAARLEAFLAAREKVGPRRERLDKALARLSGGEDSGVLARTFGTVGLLRHLGSFHLERNETLMESGVGFGEYYYLYTLAYYSWLKKPPSDGPSFKIVGEQGYLLDTLESLDESVVRTYREEQARASLNRLLLPVLRRQLEHLPAAGQGDDPRAWKKALASEIAAMEADPRRLPWQDGVPDTVERSLLPYRERLNDSYSSMCNAIEIGLARRS